METSDLPVPPYQIEWIGDTSSIDPYDDNVDVVVRFSDGMRFVATFFTLKNIETLLERYRSTGECANGLYFWASDVVIVERIADDVISATVSDLLASGEFVTAFSKG